MATKQATKKAATKKPVVDTTAVELPLEEVKEEPVATEESKDVNHDEEIFNQVADRFKNIPLSDNEKEAAAKIFQDTKESLKDTFSEENASIVAAAAADAVLMSMTNIAKEVERQENIKKLTEEYNKRKAEIEKARDERELQRGLRRLEREKKREERRAARHAL